MEDFAIIANQTLTKEEEIVYSNNKGAVIKTILLFSQNENTKEATLIFDGVAFKYLLTPGDTNVINSPIMTKEVRAMGEGVNVHITGLQL